MRLPFFNRKQRSARLGGTVPAAVQTSAGANFGRAIRSTVAMPEHASIIRQINGRMMRMYEAAVSNNLNADSPISISSANAEIFTSVMPVRSRARTLERDNHYAVAMLESHRVDVCGHEPFRLEMKVGKKDTQGKFVKESDTNTKIEEAWREAGRPENCTTARTISRLELYLQACTAMLRDGGVLARHRTGFPKNKFRYALQPLEIDRLDHYWQGKNPLTGNDIKMSIEVDEFGGPVSYWLLTKHPGEIFQIGNLKQQYREEVPAEEMIALFDIRTRAEQLTAVSRFSSVIAPLHRLQQFEVAHVTAAIWSACKPFFIIQKFPTAMEYVPDFIKKMVESQMAGNSEDGTGAGDKTSQVEPGVGEKLNFGEEVQLVDPKFPIEAATNFKKDQLRAAAAGTSTLYHHIGQDLEGINFSSGRLGERSHQDSAKILQSHFVEAYVRPHFEKWLKYAILSNQVDLPISRYDEFCRAAVFHGRRWSYINPLQDAQADILRIEAGLDSRDRVIQESERGGDAETVDSEQAADNDSAEAHGLDFSGEDPTTPTLKKGQVGEEQPAAKKTGGKQTIKKQRGRGQALALGRLFLQDHRNGHDES